ncbi:MAG TPA: hypothetical protein PKJ50_16940, partial [Casimicrobium huifangae]|nr:hypothetical protein [Casimicrobium huifangae]
QLAQAGAAKFWWAGLCFVCSRLSILTVSNAHKACPTVFSQGMQVFCKQALSCGFVPCGTVRFMLEHQAVAVTPGCELYPHQFLLMPPRF